MQNNATVKTTTPEINTASSKWEYHVISEHCSLPDTGRYLTFGIQAFEVTNSHLRPAASVHDITTIQTEAEYLAQLCNRYQLSPIHLDEFIADYLVKIS